MTITHQPETWLPHDAELDAGHQARRPYFSAEMLGVQTETTTLPVDLQFDMPGSLGNGFRHYNEGLQTPDSYEARTEEILTQLAREVDPSLAMHCMRAGGYAGSLIKAIGGRYANPRDESDARLMAAVHDYGKIKTERGTIMRSLSIPGYGEFDRDKDMPEMEKHAAFTYELLGDAQDLPEGTKLVGGCHHGHPAPGERPYGIPLSEIDTAYASDPEMRDRLQYLNKIVVAADIFDAATSRQNSYFQHGDNIYEYLRTRIEGLFPGQSTPAMEALLQEKWHYIH